MTDQDASELDRELSGLLKQLRSTLAQWNGRVGHPYPGIANGSWSEIRSDLMPACRALANRGDLFAALPHGKVLAQIGAWGGDFSVKLLELNQPRELHLFDWNLQLLKPANREILDRRGSVFYYEGDPAVSARTIAQGTFDIVYLTISKDYAAVRREIDLWLERLAPSGYLVVADVTAWDPVQGFPYGVLGAVSSTVNDRNLEIVYVSLQPRGFLNFALTRA